MFSMVALVTRLDELKTDRKLMQKQIAEGVNIPIRTYRRYEKGEREPSASIIVSLADFFNVSTDYLLGRTDNPARL
jgi:transcriptional regulator with XRE-family HTH domain